MTYDELVSKLSEMGYSVEMNDMGIPVILIPKEKLTEEFKNKIQKEMYKLG